MFGEVMNNPNFREKKWMGECYLEMLGILLCK
jgi:hypothetical protein